MTTFGDLIIRAAEVPLLDAAYDLWINRLILHEGEGWRYVVRAHGVDSSDSTAQIRYEHETAHEGRMLHWLKTAHPVASDDDARQAIKTAVKFDEDCFKYFVDGEEDAAEKAIERARRESPDFRERTYSRAAIHLSFQMR
jgi:hypothetical protein